MTHVQMVRLTLALAGIISLAVKILLFAVILHVLYSMSPLHCVAFIGETRVEPSLFWWFFVISTGLFILFEIGDVVANLYHSVSGKVDDDNKDTRKEHNIRGYGWLVTCCLTPAGKERSEHWGMLLHYFCLVLFLVIVTMVRTRPDPNTDLFIYETAQHAYASTGIKVNSNCTTTGIQKNSLTESYLDENVADANKYEELMMNDKSPLAFKIFAWTRWWTLDTKDDDKQGPELYFCSTGLEQEFDLCRKQYTVRPGQEFEHTTFNTDAQTSKVTTARHVMIRLSRYE